MIQYLVVSLIVLTAAAYSVWIFLPAATRHAAAARMAGLARRCGLGERQTGRLQAKLAAHSSCGACDSCKGCATPAARQSMVAMPRSMDEHRAPDVRADAQDRFKPR